MENTETLIYYLTALAAIIIAVMLIKRFVGCLIRTIVTIGLIIVLGVIYFYFLR